MKECIYRAEAIRICERLRDKTDNDDMAFALNWAIQSINNIPAVDVPSVKRGHWVKRMEEHTTPKYTSFTPVWSCSECGLDYDPAIAPNVNFCYKCGANFLEVNDE